MSAARILAEEEGAEMDAARERGEVVTVDVLLDGERWASDVARQERERAAGRLLRLVNSRRKQGSR
jgi:hypothetical protein